eukprot:Em0001g141a
MKLSAMFLVVSLVTGSQGLFTCSNGQQYPDDYQCDRRKDCADKSDEIGCVCYKGDIRVTGTGRLQAKGMWSCVYIIQYYPICAMCDFNRGNSGLQTTWVQLRYSNNVFSIWTIHNDSEMEQS